VTGREAGGHLLPQRAHRLGRPGPRPGYSAAAAAGCILADAVGVLRRPGEQARRRRPPLDAAAAAPAGRRRPAPAAHEPHRRHCAGAAVAAGVGRLLGGGRRLLHRAALGALRTRRAAAIAAGRRPLLASWLLPCNAPSPHPRTFSPILPSIL
jgi:hypothetical protein